MEEIEVKKDIGYRSRVIGITALKNLDRIR